MKSTSVRVLLVAWFAALLGQTARAQEAKPADVTFNDYGTIYFVRGQTKEIKVAGKNLSVQALEVPPAGGVTLRESKEFVFDPKTHMSMRKGYKMFTLTIDISADAQAGDRMMVVVTPEGKSKPKPITIRDHVPLISNFKATITSRGNKEVKIEFDFTDVAGDLGPEPLIAFECDALFLGKMFGAAHIDSIKPADDRSGSITATALVRNFRQNQCVFRITIADKNGNKSEDAAVWLDFSK